MAVPIVDETDLLPPVVELNFEESQAFFDKQAKERLGISGEEFLRRWHAGEYDEIADEPGNADLIYLSMLGLGMGGA